jgi:hypothetical protein
MVEVGSHPAPSSIHRIWQAFSSQLHRVETFKLSTDPIVPREDT